jgi:hypothetical protein
MTPPQPPLAATACHHLSTFAKLSMPSNIAAVISGLVLVIVAAVMAGIQVVVLAIVAVVVVVAVVLVPLWLSL